MSPHWCYSGTILKRLVSKASIHAHFSPTVSRRGSAVCQASISEGQILHLQPYLCRTVLPFPEVHWTFPIMGVYHSPFKMEIKSLVKEGGGWHNCTLLDLFIGSLSCLKAWKITLLSCNFAVNKEPITSVGTFSYQFEDFVKEKSLENISNFPRWCGRRLYKKVGDLVGRIQLISEWGWCRESRAGTGKLP